MTKIPKRIAILGSTGSIGTQALEVVASHPDKFKVEVLTARHNADVLIEQSIRFLPAYSVITNPNLFQKVKSALATYPIQVLSGEEALSEVVQIASIEMVLTALVGYCGLKPTIKAIEAGKHIALSNKETLVVAGELIMALAEKHQVSVIPVDSEHSAIFQCLVGEDYQSIEKLILTASGGPFRGKTIEDLKYVTKQQALKHPNWTMGAKITIDSASLMNKGLEVIEAKWLFGLSPEKVEVIVHPQSIIHSLVQFKDGSIKAQMGLPDMKLPIQYALSFPERLQSDFPRFNFADYPSLSFEKPDLDTFQNLALAFEAMYKGGNMPCVLNAANEVVVEHFLQEKISFLQMSDIIAHCLAKMPFIQNPTYEDYVQTHEQTGRVAVSLI
jgi:1-deoxy-D-xylulose-5-phosphate reductoisomerase